jgi:hypothetical protein
MLPQVHLVPTGKTSKHFVSFWPDTTSSMAWHGMTWHINHGYQSMHQFSRTDSRSRFLIAPLASLETHSIP